MDFIFLLSSGAVILVPNIRDENYTVRHIPFVKHWEEDPGDDAPCMAIYNALTSLVNLHNHLKGPIEIQIEDKQLYLDITTHKDSMRINNLYESIEGIPNEVIFKWRPKKGSQVLIQANSILFQIEEE